MILDIAGVRKWLTAFDFKPLFIEGLGWDHCDGRLEVPIDGQAFVLYAVAENYGVAALICQPGADGRLPDCPTRRRIERLVAKSAHEHVIIYTDGKQRVQIWQWVKKELGKPSVCREHTYHAGQPGGFAHSEAASPCRQPGGRRARPD